MTTLTPTTRVADSLVVSEVFGPTVQGEGPSAGRLTSFVRLGGCNLKCSWCDSQYTWNADTHDLRDELTRTLVSDILDAITGHDTPMVVVTGGETLLHQGQRGWLRLLRGLSHRGKRIEVETNGTIIPSRMTLDRVAQFNVSPKLANSGESRNRRLVGNALTALARSGKAVFKFVARDAGDVDEAAAIVVAHELPRDKVWIMPEGVNVRDVIINARRVAARTLAHRFNLTTRAHILVWGEERGR